MTKDYDVSESERALEAIVARIQGEWDNPFLIEYGPLSNLKEDVLHIAEKALSTEQPITPTEAIRYKQKQIIIKIIQI
jgi:hypothetical protein